MKNSEYKRLLAEKKVNIHQMEDLLTAELHEIDEFFSIPNRTIWNYLKKKWKFKRSLRIKNKVVSESFKELNKFVKKISDDNIDIADLEMEASKGENVLNRLESAINNSWNDETKLTFEELFQSYRELKIKNEFGILLSGKLLYNEYFKLLIQLIIFLVTFFGSYFISNWLESVFDSSHPFWNQFIIAVILFLSLERFTNWLENYLLIWRVRKLQEFKILITPLVIEAKKRL